MSSTFFYMFTFYRTTQKRSKAPAMAKLNEKRILSFLIIGSLGQCRFENILTCENEMNLRRWYFKCQLIGCSNLYCKQWVRFIQLNVAAITLWNGPIIVTASMRRKGHVTTRHMCVIKREVILQWLTRRRKRASLLGTFIVSHWT